MYLIYRNEEYHWAICDDNGYILTHPHSLVVYSPNLSDLVARTFRLPYRRFNFNNFWQGDDILWWYPIESLDNIPERYPELFI